MNQQYEAPSEANPGWPTPLSSPRPRALETSAPISKLMSISQRLLVPTGLEPIS